MVDIKDNDLIRSLGQLHPGTRNYIVYKDKLSKFLMTIPRYHRLYRHSFGGDESAVEEIDEIENEERRYKEKQRYKESVMSSFGVVLMTIDQVIENRLKDDPEWTEVSNQKDFKRLIQLLDKQISTETERPHERKAIREYLHNLRQGRFETFEQYSDKTRKTLNQLELIGGRYDEEELKDNFVEGINERFAIIKQALLNASYDYRTYSLQEIANFAEELRLANRIPYLPPELKQRYEDKSNQMKKSSDQKGSHPRPNIKKRVNSMMNDVKKDDENARNKKPKTTGGLSDKVTCKSCKQPGHTARYCQHTTCYKCGGYGHMSRDCGSKLSPNNNDTKGKRIYAMTTLANPNLNNVYESETLMDTAANLGLTNDITDLKSIQYKRGKFYNANGSPQETRIQGKHQSHGGETIYMKDAPKRIAPFAQLRQNYRPEYVDEEDRFIFTDRESGAIEYEAINKDNIYVLRHISQCNVLTSSSEGTDRTNDEVYELHRRLLHENRHDLMESLQQGHYKDVITDPTLLTNSDWENVDSCITCNLSKDGRLKNLQRGKRYSRRRVTFEDDDGQIQEKDRSLATPKINESFMVKCYFDIVFIDKFMSLTMVVKPYNYLVQTWIENKTREELFLRIRSFIIKCQACATSGVLWSYTWIENLR